MGEDGTCVEYTWKLAPKYKSGQSEIQRFSGWGESATLSLRFLWDHLMSQQPLGRWCWPLTLNPHAAYPQWPTSLPGIAGRVSSFVWDMAPLTPSFPSHCSSHCWPLSQLFLLLGTHSSDRPKVRSLTDVCLNRRNLFRDYTKCSSWQLTYLLSVLLFRV